MVRAVPVLPTAEDANGLGKLPAWYGEETESCSTAIMGIPPEETQAFRTDFEYRLGVSEAMNDVLEREGVDEVILTFSEDGYGYPSEFYEDLGVSMNPGDGW